MPPNSGERTPRLGRGCRFALTQFLFKTSSAVLCHFRRQHCLQALQDHEMLCIKTSVFQHTGGSRKIKPRRRMLLRDGRKSSLGLTCITCFQCKLPPLPPHSPIFPITDGYLEKTLLNQFFTCVYKFGQVNYLSGPATFVFLTLLLLAM